MTASGDPGAPTGGGVPGRSRRLTGWLWRHRLATGFIAGLVTGLLLGLVPPLILDRDTGIELGELVVMMDRDQSVGEQRIRLIDEWVALQREAQERAGVPEERRTRVRIIELPPTATAAHSQMVAHAQGGGGDVDLYSLDVTWVAEFAQQGWLRPLDRSTVDEHSFLDKPLAAGVYDGKLWALPFNTDAPLLYYHRGLVTEPETWADVERQWQELAGSPRTPVAGYAGQLADYEGLTVNFLEAVLAQDPEALAGEAGFQGGEAWAAALRWPGEGLRSGLILPESLVHSESDSVEAFRTMQVPFMRNWPVAHRRLTEVEAEAGAGEAEAEEGAGDAEVTEGDAVRVRPEDVGVAPLPTPGILGGQSLAIARGSDKPRAAQHLMEFLTSPRSQEKLFVDGGFVPTQRLVYDDLIRQERYAYLAVVQQAVEQARPRPVHPRYELISEAIRRVVRCYLEAVTSSCADAPLVSDNPEVLAGQFAGQLAGELTSALDGYRR